MIFAYHGLFTFWNTGVVGNVVGGLDIGTVLMSFLSACSAWMLSPSLVKSNLTG